MELFQLLGGLVALWVAFRLGYAYRGFVIIKTLAEAMAEADKKQKDIVAKLNSNNADEMLIGVEEAAKRLKLTLLNYEIVNEQHFFYNRNTGVFVCQGTTLEEAAENYHKSDKNVACVIDTNGSSRSCFIVEGKLTSKLPETK